MPFNEIILIIILIFVIVPVGIVIILFASRIGIWIFNFPEEIRSGLSETRARKIFYNKWMFSWATISHSIGPAFSIWIVRVIGIFLLLMAVFAIFLVLYY